MGRSQPQSAEWTQALVIWIAVFAIEFGVGFAILGESLKKVL